MNNVKEINFIKQVERTAKRDAYEKAILYVKRFGIEDALVALKEKADLHSEYLKGLPFEYDYATQSLVNKRSYELSVSEVTNE